MIEELKKIQRVGIRNTLSAIEFDFCIVLENIFIIMKWLRLFNAWKNIPPDY